LSSRQIPPFEAFEQRGRWFVGGVLGDELAGESAGETCLP
jgi:hypothetical protein